MTMTRQQIRNYNRKQELFRRGSGIGLRIRIMHAWWTRS